MSICTTLFGKISHASLFITGQLRNPWQMLTEPWGSAEPRLKNTVLGHFIFALGGGTRRTNGRTDGRNGRCHGNEVTRCKAARDPYATCQISS